jgi:hypothetical protein
MAGSRGFPIWVIWFIHLLFWILSSLNSTFHWFFTVFCPGLLEWWLFGSPAGSLYNHMASVVAIDPKFCTYVQLGKSNSQTKFRSSLIIGLTTRGPKLRKTTPDLMTRSSPNFNHRYIWPTFEGHRVQSSKWQQYWHISLLFDLEHSNLEWTCILAPSTFLPNFGPIGRQIWPPGGHLGKPTKSYSLYIHVSRLLESNALYQERDPPCHVTNFTIFRTQCLFT